MLYDNTFSRIDLDAISDNFDAVCRRAGKPVMAVVKADAYGHGAVAVARLLEERCAFFGVANVPEALELRRNGIRKPILVLGHSPEGTFADAVSQDIRLTLSRYEEALAVSRAAQALKKTAYIHLAVDTGMSRIGFQVTGQDADICAEIANLPNIKIEGLFSHFATADCEDLSATCAQAEQFSQFQVLLRQRGICIPICHLDNSAGIMHFGCHCDMVRAGIVLYGLYPSEEVDKHLLSLRPAMSLHTHIVNLQLLPAGRAISYGGTFVTEKPTLVATLPVGYADGYRRNLSNRFYVIVCGRRAPILGRVCMDQMMVNVTDIPGAALGDEVLLFGPELPIEAIAAAADSFNYEFACGISRRVPRIYYREGREISALRYLSQP